jgi:hypothetical protein
MADWHLGYIYISIDCVYFVRVGGGVGLQPFPSVSTQNLAFLETALDLYNYPLDVQQMPD